MSCGVQEKLEDSTQEKMGEEERKPTKPNKKFHILLVDGEKKRILQAPVTDDLQRSAGPGKGASETSRVTPDPLSVAWGRPRMALDQPSWQAS